MKYNIPPEERIKYVLISDAIILYVGFKILSLGNIIILFSIEDAFKYL